MTVKGRDRDLHDPRNRAIAVVGDSVDIKYFGEMENLSKKARRWRATATVAMGEYGTVNIAGGDRLICGAVTQHYHTEKMKITEAVDYITNDLREDMGASAKVKHTIHLDISIKRNKG